MSYALSSALQAAVYQKLSADTNLQAIIGSAIYDTLPSGAVPAIYVTLGAEKVRDASDMTGDGAVHDLLITVVSAHAGFQTAKEAAAAISDVLDDNPLPLSRGCLISMRFNRAVAMRENNGQSRRIDMTFRARLEVN